MFVMWVQDGKKLTILSLTVIFLGAFLALNSHDVKLAFLFGLLDAFFAFIAIKSAIGWAWAKESQRRRKTEYNLGSFS